MIASREVMKLAVVNVITEDTWKVFQNTRDVELRNQILLNYVHLLKHIVARMMPSYRNYVEYDDLFSYGLLGLMDAIEKFDPRKGIKFETYASLRIRGSIIDEVRKLDWIPRSTRKKSKMIEEGYRQLEQQLGRPPTDEEAASHLRMTVEEFRKALDETASFHLLSFEEIIQDAVAINRLSQSSFGSPEESFQEKEIKEYLALCIDQLSDREKLVITLYYFEELTLKEIGRVLEVTESRISQIHSKALLKLRMKLQKLFDEL